MPTGFDDTVPAPLPDALAVRLNVFNVKDAETIFVVFMLLIVHVAEVLPLPLVESQLPDHVALEPVPAVAVNVTEVPVLISVEAVLPDG